MKRSEILAEDPNPRDMQSMVGMDSISEFNEEWLPTDIDVEDWMVFPPPTIDKPLLSAAERLILSTPQTREETPDP